jgi:hypothetical protein
MAKYIEDGDLQKPGLTKECYNIEYVLEDLEGMNSAKFDYYVDDRRYEGVIYLSNILTDSNKIEAEVNSIRRQVNLLRKELGFKLYDKVAIEVIRNQFLDDLDIELFNSLVAQLGGNVLVSDTIDLQHSTIKSIDGSMEFILTVNRC